MYNTLLTIKYSNAAELLRALETAIYHSEHKAEMICVTVTESSKEPVVRLFTETLTDGSETYNIAVRG